VRRSVGIRTCGPLAFGLALLAGDQFRAAAQRAPSFRADIDVTRIDVSVLDSDRHPIRDLTAADITVLADGKPQKIVALSEVSVPDPVAPAVTWLRDVTPDVSTNRFRDRRIWMIIMDDATAQPDLWAVNRAKQIARAIVSKMGAGDVAAVVFTRDNRASQDFTSDRSRLNAAIDRYSASAGSTIPDTPMPIYSQYSVVTLKEGARLLASLPDRRKLLVYISGGVPVNLGDLSPVALGSGSLAAAQDASGLLDAALDVLRYAMSSNVNIYSFDPAGLRVDPEAVPTEARTRDARDRLDFLRALAASTGGRAAVNNNDAMPAIAQMFVENASYYLLGYQALPRQTNKTADVVITVNRPGAIVRARRQVSTVKAANERAPSLLSEIRAVSGLLPVSDLPLAVSAAPFRKSAGTNLAAVSIVLGVQQQAGTKGRETVDLVTTAFDADGRSKAFARTTGAIVMKPGLHAGEMVMYEVLTKLELKPGRYQLRLAAHRDGTDENGSVFTDIDVPDFSGEVISLSGVVLSSLPAPAAAPKDALAALIPVTPTTLRDFTRGATVEAFVRIYQGGKSTVQPVTVSVKFIDSNDVTVAARREPIPATNFLADRSTEYRVSLPLLALKPGPHLMRIEVPLGNHLAKRDVMFLVR
jgi:VWFA-related protein